MAKFVHLHGHTEYSLLDGLSKMKKLVKTVKEMGMSSVAVTDHGAMYGAIEFYKECMKEEIKPIIGCELYVARRSHKDKEGKLDTEPYHLTVLAKNDTGYKNLMKLVSIGHLDGYYYKPRVDRELLKEYHEGLIVLSGCPAGEFIRSLRSGDGKSAEEVIKAYIEIFGEENYFLELQNHEYDTLLKQTHIDPRVRRDLEEMSDVQKMTFQAVKEFHKKYGVKMVATNDFHYVGADDANAQDAVVCVQTGKFIRDIDRLRMIDTPNLYVRSEEEMFDLFKEFPEAVENTAKVAEMVNLEITLAKPYFPIFDIPGGLTPMEHLRNISWERFHKMYDDSDLRFQERKDRLQYELDIIDQKGYGTYFLIVADFINWCTDHEIITNTRGSAAGSFTLYVLGITLVDPINYMLPFERFLNPQRPSLPDIDSDIADNRRDEVIHYIMDKYGHDKVAHIVTFGTMMGRAAVRDIGRVLGLPYADVDKIAKLVPQPQQGFHKPLSDAVQEIPELQTLYNSDTQAKQLLDLAQKVEGTVRHASVHAAGIVIAPAPLTDFTPIQREAKGEKIVTQYDMHGVGEDGVGLVKMDMLGIRNLSILGHSVEIVEKSQGVKVDLKNIPLDDRKTYELLSRGETMGCFQIEGAGMTKYMMELRPTNIFDIMAMIALYRPGPISVIPDYIARKRDPSKITYFDPRMKDYLERSLGLLVYQDDVLLTAINLAGYSWLEADKFRKAMGKKIKEEMIKQEEHFIHGSEERGLTHEQAVALFDLIKPFAAYGFNKAHAASYAMITYQTAYMKANFPVEFMAAVMSAEYGNTEKIASAIDECQRMGIVVLPPDVNYSGVGFTVSRLSSLPDEELKRSVGGIKTKQGDRGIRFGMSAIKNVGIGAIESIIQAREERPFTDLMDLCLRVDTRLVNRKALESLIKAGAMDSFGSRAALLMVLEQCLEEAHKHNKARAHGQSSLFEGFDMEDDVTPISAFNMPNIAELSLEEMLAFERDLLGFYLHEPGYMKKIKQLNPYVSCRAAQISEDDNRGRKLTVGGVILDAKKIVTKKSGAEMAFVKIFDGTGELECVVFPKAYDNYKDLLVKEQVILIDGKADFRVEQKEDSGDEVDTEQVRCSFLVDSIREFDPGTAQRIDLTSVQIELPEGIDKATLSRVNETLKRYPGGAPISVLVPRGDTFKKMNLAFTVEPNFELVQNIEQILGPNTIRLL